MSDYVANIPLMVDVVDDDIVQTRLIGNPDLPEPVVTELMHWVLQKHLGLVRQGALKKMGWEDSPTGPAWHNSKFSEEQCWTLDWNRSHTDEEAPY